MSSQIGPATAKTSMRLTTLIIRLLDISTTKKVLIDHLLRTLAHFIGFFILGVLSNSTARITFPNQKQKLILIFGICSLIALLDEIKKIYIVGRHLSWAEAGLNLLGVLCGTLLVDFFALIKTRPRDQA